MFIILIFFSGMDESIIFPYFLLFLLLILLSFSIIVLFSFLLALITCFIFFASLPSLSKVSNITSYNFSFIERKFDIIYLNTLNLTSKEPCWHFVLYANILTICIYDLLIWISLWTGADNNSGKFLESLFTWSDEHASRSIFPNDIIFSTLDYSLF